MPKSPKTFPFGALERDLCNLARHRVAESIHSVLQVADTKETKFLITMQAMVQAVAMCSGAYSAVYSNKLEDPFEVAKIVLDLASKVNDGGSNG